MSTKRVNEETWVCNYKVQLKHQRGRHTFLFSLRDKEKRYCKTLREALGRCALATQLATRRSSNLCSPSWPVCPYVRVSMSHPVKMFLYCHGFRILVDFHGTFTQALSLPEIVYLVTPQKKKLSGANACRERRRRREWTRIRIRLLVRR